jgi:glucokinase
MTANYAVGIDVGGTKISAGLVSPSGKVVKRSRLDTPRGSGRAVLDEIAVAAAQVWMPGVKAVGIGLPGLVDAERGIFLGGPNLPKSLRGAKMAACFSRRLGVPVSLDNDARCFALGEAAFGAGRGYDTVVGVTVGTGIGSGIVMGGRPYRGRDNAAGEIGHTMIDGCGPKCSCGIPGHYEAMASGTAAEKIYRLISKRRLSLADISERTGRGDRRASETMAFVAWWLGVGLANLVHTLNPDCIVVGGGGAKAKGLLRAAKKSFADNLAFRELKSTPILPAKLGEDANLIGAAELVRR